jgi:hypothetical protein
MMLSRKQGQDFDRLQAQQQEDRIPGQQAVGGLAQVAGEAMAEHHRQQDQGGRQQGQGDLADQIAVNDGRHDDGAPAREL